MSGRALAIRQYCHDVNFTMNAGQTNLIIGTSGSRENGIDEMHDRPLSTR